MSKYIRQLLLACAATVLAFTASAADKSLLTTDSEAALQSLYKTTPGAQALGDKAAGVLVFPKIVRAGFIVGGSGGEGVLYVKGKPSAYYSSGSASVGLQAGAQSFAYAVFFMTQKELKDFRKSEGWDIGMAPTVVVIDSGAGKDINTTTAASGIYAFIFDQSGLMAGLALQGQKISKIK